jgi:exopolyphosphatase/guanosine-5'-triphosphate,3'-diphosphate pyrophosphatase
VNRAVISLGTNTARVLVVSAAPNGTLQQLDHRQAGTRLGEALRDAGTLAPEAVARTLAAVAEFMVLVRERDAALVSIATSAVRRASDAAAFAERMRSVTGVPLQVLAGPVEAEVSFRGATYGCAHDGARVAVLDVGGGSTECAVGRDGTLEQARSLEIGSVRVGERFADLLGTAPGEPAREAAAAARRHIAEVLAPLGAFERVRYVRCVAGTPLTVGAILLGSHVDAVSGSVLSRAQLDATISRLLELTLAERRALTGMLPQRADILPAGALVLSEALRLLGHERFVLEANDLLLGFLLMQSDGATAK